MPNVANLFDRLGNAAMGKRQLSAPFALGIALSLTAAAWFYADRSERMQDEILFRESVADIQLAIQMRMNTYVNTLVQARGLFEIRPHPSRDDFRRYVDAINLTEQYPGIQGIGYTKRIAPEELAAHEAAIRAEGFPSYQVWPTYQRDEYFSIIYLEPFDWRNRRAFGYDMGSDPTRREAMDRARDSGLPTASHAVTLVQETSQDTQVGFLIYVPVYDPEMPQETVEARRRALIGFVYAPFRTRDLFLEIFERDNWVSRGIRFSVSLKGPGDSGHTLLFENLPAEALGDARPRFYTVVQVPLAQRSWDVAITSLPYFGASKTRDSTMIAIVGVALSLLVFFLVRAANRQTDLARLHARARLSEEGLNRGIIASTQDGIGIFDLAGRLVSMSDVGKAAFGLEGESWRGRLWPDLWPADQRELVRQAVEAAAAGTTGRFQGRYVLPGSKEDRWSDVVISPINDSNGQPERLVAVCRDVTHQKRVERTLQEAKDAAEQANAAKSAFVANMSHEMRTPLGVIVGFADLGLTPGQTADEMRGCLEAIRRNASQLADLIDDVLDLSKVESGKFELEPLFFSTEELIQDLEESLGLKAREKGIELRFRKRSSLPPTVYSDPTRVRQILTNVIGNAIKFTEQGSVTVRFGAREKGGRVRLRVAVKDTGIGLTPAQRRRLFKPFAQGDQSTTRRYGGTGLGLVLSRKLARALGGDLRLLASVPGKGTTFVLEIDGGSVKALERKAPEPKAKVPAVSKGGELSGKEILLVEDTPDNQKLIGLMLTLAGAKVDIADNGQRAIELANANAYDAVLMDIQMPVLDGYQSTARLRRMGHKLPIVALTAHALKSERARAADVGFDDYLTKPISRHDLVSTLKRAIERR